MSNRDLLFTLTKKDFDVQHFCCGGKGGQKQNKTASGTRIVHSASGAVGESREERSQAQNTKIAFKRLVNTSRFKTWLRMEAGAKMLGFQNIEKLIDSMVSESNLKIEIQDEEGNWITK